MTDTLDITAETLPATGKKTTITLAEITDITTRLGRLLAKENHLLDTLQFAAIDALQDEKNKLISALEIHKKILRLDPSIKQGFAAEDIEEFEQVSKMFDSILTENYRQLMRMKSVNAKVVEVIAKAAIQLSSPPAYAKNGAAARATGEVSLAFYQNV